jgi:hypothetical protein
MGGIAGFENVASSAGFIYFFLFVSLSRLFNWTLRDSLENPVFKLFFIPLDNRLRFNIQSKVEGLGNETSRFFAGLLIFALAFVPFFEVIHISIFLVVLVGLYFLVINTLYHGYRQKIKEKLEASTDNQQDKLERGFTQISNRLERNLMEPSSSKAVFSFKLLEKINAANISTWVNSLMKNQDEGARQYAQERMNEMKGLSISDHYVIRMDANKASNGSDRKVLSKSELALILENAGDITKTRIQKLTRSPNPNDRHYAAELLLHTSKEEGVSFLMELLNDIEPSVRLKVCDRHHSKGRNTHFRARRSRSPLEDTVEVAACTKPCTEAPRLGKVDLLVVRWNSSADRTSLRWILRSINRLAPPTRSYGKRRTERIRLLDNNVSLWLIVDTAYCRID